MSCLNMKVLGIACVVPFVFFAASASADNVANKTITKIYTYDSHAAILYTPAESNDVGCPGTYADRTAVIDWTTNSEKKGQFAALLSAYLMDKSVDLGIAECSGKFGGGVPLVYRVDMH